MKWVVIVREAVAGMSLAYLPREAANSSLIEVCNQAPLLLPKMRDLESLTLMWRSFSRWGKEGVSSALALKEANTSVMTSCNQWPLWLPRMQDLKLLTLRWRSFLGSGKECLTTYFEHKGGQFIEKEYWGTIVGIVQLTVRYLNATINTTTWNAKPQIGPNGSNQTWQNPRVDGYRAVSGPPRSSGSGFWTVLEPNRTVFLVQTQTAGRLPGPIANTSWD